MSPSQVKEHLERGVVLLDTRDTASFGGVHIPGSINVGFAKQTANWIEMVIDPEADLILLVTDEKAYDNMCVQLHRIGYDNIVGYLYGGIGSSMGGVLLTIKDVDTGELLATGIATGSTGDTKLLMKTPHSQGMVLSEFTIK